MATELFAYDSLMGASYRHQIRTGLFRSVPAYLLASANAGLLYVYVKRVGNPGDLTIRILDNIEDVFGGFSPGSTTISTFVLSEGDAVDGTYGWYAVDLGGLTFPDGDNPYFISLESGTSLVDDYWESEDAYELGGWTWTDGSGEWSATFFAPAMRLYEEEYVFTPPSGRPTTKRLIGIAESALWYEDV